MELLSGCLVKTQIKISRKIPLVQSITYLDVSAVPVQSGNLQSITQVKLVNNGATQAFRVEPRP